MVRNIVLRFAIGVALAAHVAQADEPAFKACRSVHLGYPAAEGDVFYNEAAIERSAAGTYFMVCGFDVGYFGIQELGNGKKVVLFSVWDPRKQDNAKAVPEEQRVQVRHQDGAVRVKRFGGEGTGGQCFLDFDWKVGETYRFCVAATADGERSAFAGYFYLPEQKAWKHLVTFSTLATKRRLRGYYSFVEDFRRNGESYGQQRVARFGNGWVRTVEGQWIALTKARFTADSSKPVNINATLDGERYVLATGGETKNTGTALNKFLLRSPSGVTLPELAPLGKGR